MILLGWFVHLLAGLGNSVGFDVGMSLFREYGV